MLNLKKTLPYNFYWIIFYIVMFIFCRSLSGLFHTSAYFVINFSLSLYLSIYSYFVLPIYFNSYFCCLIYCFSINYSFFNIQYFLCHALLYTNNITLSEYNYSYSLILILFISSTIISQLLTLIVYFKHDYYIILKKSFLMIYALLLILVNSSALFNKQIIYFSSTDSIKTTFFILTMLVLLFSLLLIYLTYKRSLYYAHFELYASIAGILLPLHATIICTTVYTGYNNSLINHLISGLLVLILLRPLSSHSFFNYLDDLNCKLLLHRESNTLLQKYITNINQSKDAMSEQYAYLNTQYGQILSVYPDALFLLDDKGLILNINEHALHLLSCPEPTTLLNTPITDFIKSTDSIYIKSLIKNILDEKSYKLTTLSQVKTSDSTLKDVEILLTLSSYTCPKQVIMSIKDLSSRNYTYNLEQQVTLEKLKVEFFSTLSHELKTPVNVIYSASQLQNQLIQEEAYDKISTYNTMVSANCLRLLKLINNILDLNRVDSNYFKVSPQIFNIVTATEDLLSSTSPYAEKKNISLTFDTDEEELYCSLDPDMLERILLNLFSNSIKYGIADGFLNVTITYLSPHVRLSIADNGIGIPEESHACIFDRFSRAENGLIRTNEGAGIGLSLVKSFVELNSGSITFNSTKNQGTEFIIYFPTFGTTEPPNTETYSNFANSDKIEMEFSDIFS